MKKAIIYGHLWTAELDDKVKVVLSEAGECNAEREKGDIPTSDELLRYLREKGWNIIDELSYISEHRTGDEESDYRIRQLNPNFSRRFPKLSKPGLLITPQCSEMLVDSSEGIDLEASVFSVAYRDNRDRYTNPFHYTGIIASDVEEMHQFFREDERFNNWMFGVVGKEISDLLKSEHLRGKPIGSGIYITPNAVKRYNR